MSALGADSCFRLSALGAVSNGLICIDVPYTLVNVLRRSYQANNHLLPQKTANTDYNKNNKRQHTTCI